MGEDYRAWHRQLNLNSELPNLKFSVGTELDLGLSAYLKPGPNMAPMNGPLPSFGLSEAPNLLGGQPSEPHGWLYCLPCFRQAFTPAVPSVFREQLPAFHNETCRGTLKPNVECGQKKFLVVDQSGDQTTLIYSSGVGDPIHCLASWKRTPDGPSMEDVGTERVLKDLSKPILTDESYEINETVMESEMHEDTEELDALLYSDDDDDGVDSTEDDEVTSTGHSPSTMTSFNKQEEWYREDADEVASYAGSTKKGKLFDGGYDGKPSRVDTASSAKRSRSLELEDDAESGCADDKGFGSREPGFKKIRKEKIRETVSILQTIIPDGEGKDAVVVLDEAIQYLKSLKLKAQAFGLDAL